MIHDKYIRDTSGNKLASYGPRHLAVDLHDPDGLATIEEAAPEAAAFWGVYRHNTEGLAQCIGDACDEGTARAFATLVAQVETIKRMLV